MDAAIDGKNSMHQHLQDEQDRVEVVKVQVTRKAAGVCGEIVQESRAECAREVKRVQVCWVWEVRAVPIVVTRTVGLAGDWTAVRVHSSNPFTWSS